jgi:hypothetical protein
LPQQLFIKALLPLRAKISNLRGGLHKETSPFLNLRLKSLERWVCFPISKLRAILTGSRDPGLADDPDLECTDAAEILFLIEKTPTNDTN